MKKVTMYRNGTFDKDTLLDVPHTIEKSEEDWYIIKILQDVRYFDENSLKYFTLQHNQHFVIFKHDCNAYPFSLPFYEGCEEEGAEEQL